MPSLIAVSLKDRKSDRELRDRFKERLSEADCLLSRCVFAISSRVEDRIWRVCLVLLTTRRHSANQRWLGVTDHDMYIIKPQQHRPVQPEFMEVV